LPAMIAALVSVVHPIFLARYLIFSLPAMILLAAAGMMTMTRMRLGLILVIALCAMSVPTIFRDYHKPREDWRSASKSILASAQAGDAVVFFPFYTRIMLDYYHDRYLQNVSPVHVFAPGFYDAGEDERDLLRALDADPQQFRHVWIVLYRSDSAKHNVEPMSAAVAARLQRVFGPPQTRQFADIEVLGYGK